MLHLTGKGSILDAIGGAVEQGAKDVGGFVSRDVINPLLSADRFIANNTGLTDVGKVTGVVPGNPQQAAQNLAVGAVKFPIQAGEQLGNTLGTSTGIGEQVPNTTPSLQSQYRSVRKSNGTLPAVLQTGFSGVSDVAPLLGGVKPIKAAISETPRNEIGAVGSNVNEPMPEPKPTKEAASPEPTVPINTTPTPQITVPEDSLSNIHSQNPNPYMAPEPSASIGGDIADPKVWADAMGITEDQARQDIERGQAPAKLGPTPEVTPLEAATVKQAAMPRQLTPEERQAIINEQENQQTANQVGLKTKEGNTKGAIAEAEGIETERQGRFNNADRLGKKLDSHDQQLLSERADPNVKIEPHNPEAFDKATKAYDDAYDYHLASVRAAGGATLRYGEGKYAPLYLKATSEQMDKLDVPDSERIQKGAFTGFRDATRQYRSYTDARQKAGLEPLNGSPLEDARMYADKSHVPLRNALLRGALEKSNPTEVSDVGKGFDAAGKPFRQGAAAELPFNVSENVDKYLKNYHAPYEPNSTAGKVMVKSAEKVNAVSKRALWFGSMFHYGNETMSFLGSNLLHPIVATKGVSRAIETAASKQGWQNILEGARTTTINGTSILEGARSMGVELPENSRLNRVSSAFSLTQAEAALKAGIDPNSAEGVAAGSLINKIAGQKNTAVEGASPGIDRFIRAGAAAPRWTPSQLALVRDAFTKPGIGRFTEGGGARNAIIGKRALGAAVGITGSALIAGQMPTVAQAEQEAGLNLNNPVPNIKIKSKNSKGEGQVIDSPTDPLGLAVGLAKNPSHFLQSRFSPALSAGVKIATNTNWNGDPLVDTNQPGAWKTRIAKALENSVTPIGVQNFTNLQHNQNNPNVEQGAIQEIGGRLKTDPNDPQAKANANYFKVLGETTDELKKGGQYGQYWAQKFNDLHPANTTDASGQKYPVPFDPASSATKYDAYTATNAQGQRVLSPVFFADQRLAQATPGYPSSPLYSLNGEGVNVDGSGASQALVALEYQHAQDPAAKTVILNANGGQNGWLAKYENQVADYSKNYQQNLTTYFQGLGWTPKAIDNYWADHPSTPDPIDDVNFDKPTTDLINQYYRLSASGDSTAASKFFSDHADVLGAAFDRTAQHSNALRTARGELQLQGYPAESGHVKEVLAAMPQGADKASKKARALAINGNPDVNQFLSSVALYEALGKGAQFRYVNPANPSATEAENINAGGQAGQTFLKDVVSIGKYGIASKTGADGNSTYTFDPNEVSAGGGASSGGSRGGFRNSKINGLSASQRREAKLSVKYAYHPAKVFIRGQKKPHFQKVKIASAPRSKVNIKAKSTPVA